MKEVFAEKPVILNKKIDLVISQDDASKQEGNTGDEKISKASSSSASSWSRLKDPRIVRVSRAFGGKDRHSKVCTVRGLRDRRVRLSVPTAIQLYDLQDRLGLNQPSKVVDWLLDAAKHEIDELPPLQMPPGNFSQPLQPVLTSQGVGAPQSSCKGPRIGRGIHWTGPVEPSGSNTWDSDAILRPKAKEAARESANVKETWARRSEEGKQSNFEDNHGTYVSSNNFFSRHNHSSAPGIGLLNSSAQPYSSLIRWDPSTLSLAQSGSPGLTPQPEDFQNFNVVSLASTVSIASGPQMLNSNSDNPLSNSLTPATDSASQQGRPFDMSTTTTNFLPTQKDGGNELSNNEGEFRSR